MKSVTPAEYAAMEPRRESSQTGWPNAQDAASLFAAAGIDSGSGSAGAGGDSGFPFSSAGGDGMSHYGSPGGDWGSLLNPAAGDYMAIYPGARFDHGMLEIPFGPDSVSPAYLTLDATGAVGAEFTGRVKAQGLDLITATGGSAPDTRQIRWLRESDGSVSARFVSLDTAANVQLQQMQAELSTKRAALEIHINSASDSDTWIDADVAGTAAEKRRRLIDALGQSSFLQIWDAGSPLIADKRIAWGFATCTWAGGVTSGSTTVTHGLGTGPNGVWLCPIPGGASVLEAMYRVTNITATQFAFDGTRTGVFTGSGRVAWLAVV